MRLNTPTRISSSNSNNSNMANNNDCGCKAGRDIDRLQTLFGVRDDRDKNILVRLWHTVIRGTGVVVLLFLSLFAIPFVWHNAMENKRRTGRPFVSLPRGLKTPMKHVINSYAKRDKIKKTDTNIEDGR